MGGLVGWTLGLELLGIILGPLIIYLIATLVMEGSGRAGSILLMPSGSSTPHDKEYSRAEALAARGDFEGAVAVYQEAILEEPSEAEPYLRIARIYRDHLQAPEDSLIWFRKALDDAQPPRGKEVLARKEVAELLIHRLGQPRRAAPDLARLAESREGLPEGFWAREELEKIKKLIAEEDDLT